MGIWADRKGRAVNRDTVIQPDIFQAVQGKVYQGHATSPFRQLHYFSSHSNIASHSSAYFWLISQCYLRVLKALPYHLQVLGAFAI
jgi:hypothetical protein